MNKQSVPALKRWLQRQGETYNHGLLNLLLFIMALPFPNCALAEPFQNWVSHNYTPCSYKSMDCHCHCNYNKYNQIKELSDLRLYCFMTLSVQHLKALNAHWTLPVSE